MIGKRQKILKEHKENVSSIWFAEKDKYWKTYLHDKKGDRYLVKRRDFSDLEDVVYDHYNNLSQRSATRVQDSFDRWHESRLEIVEDGKLSRATYDRDLYNFESFFSSIADMKWKECNEKVLMDYVVRIVRKGTFDTKKFNRLVGTLKNILAQAYGDGQIDWNIENFIILLRKKINNYLDVKEIVVENEVYSIDEIDRLETYLSEHVDNIRNLGLLLMINTGLRDGELVALKFSDIIKYDDGNYSIKINRTQTVTKKEKSGNNYSIKETPKTRAGKREVDLPESKKWIIEKLSEFSDGRSDDFIFRNNNGKRLTTCCFIRRLKTVCKELDIPYRSTHKFRKTYATLLVENDLPELYIMKQLGHADIQTTKKHYVRNRNSHNKNIALINKAFQ